VPTHRNSFRNGPSSFAVATAVHRRTYHEVDRPPPAVEIKWALIREPIPWRVEYRGDECAAATGGVAGAVGGAQPKRASLLVVGLRRLRQMTSFQDDVRIPYQSGEPAPPVGRREQHAPSPIVIGLAGHSLAGRGVVQTIKR
jgi:hypothetical protein